MTTPKQDRTAIETPFGNGWINDHRDHETPPSTDKHARAEVAAITFENLVVNKKNYGYTTLYVTRWNGEFGTGSRDYRALTPAARDAVDAFFKDFEPLKPFLEDLDADGIRAARKHAVAYPILRAIIDQASNRYHPSSEGNTKDGLIDEVLVEIVQARAKGVHFANIDL